MHIQYIISSTSLSPSLLHSTAAAAAAAAAEWKKLYMNRGPLVVEAASMILTCLRQTRKIRSCGSFTYRWDHEILFYFFYNVSYIRFFYFLIGCLLFWHYQFSGNIEGDELIFELNWIECSCGLHGIMIILAFSILYHVISILE